MYCPSCGTETVDQNKYCVKCGVNLRHVQAALGKGDAGGWDAHARDHDRRREERRKRRDEWRKKTPEEKRFNEIKAGVIVSSVGFGLMVFLGILFDAIASTMDGPEADILRSLWAVGLVPFMVGLGILFNGIYVSKRIINLKRQQELPGQKQQPFFSAPNTSPVARLAEPAQYPVPDFSVTESTTTKLREPASANSPNDAN